MNLSRNRYLTADGEDVTELVREQTDLCLICLRLPDGRLWSYTRVELEEGDAGICQRSETLRRNEQWRVKLPSNVLSPQHSLGLLALQIGPFLRVIDVDDCLPILAEPSAWGR